MRLIYLLPLLLLTVAGCQLRRNQRTATPDEYSPKASSDEVRYERFRPEQVRRPVVFDFPRLGNFDYHDYIPDTLQPELLPVRNVRLNFHVMNSADTLYQLYGKAAVNYSREVVGYTNHFMVNNPKNWLNVTDTIPAALPTRINFVLPDDPETGNPAVYEHYDEKLYGYIHKGRNRNRSDMEVVNKYNVRPGEELNIYWMGPPRERVKEMGKYTTSGNGIYLGNAIKVTDVLSKDVPSWAIRQVFAHELGHALGLPHAWTRSDGCPDTPVHPNNSWQAKERGPGLTSNNLMDYSPNQEALTPCQIGQMHVRIATIGNRARRWVRPDWCTYDAQNPIVIERDVVLNGARDFNTDIIIRRGGSLTVNNRMHLPAGATIRVEPGGELALGPEAILHNDCGGQWAGISVGKLPRGITGKVTVDPMAVLLNEAP